MTKKKQYMLAYRNENSITCCGEVIDRPKKTPSGFFTISGKAEYGIFWFEKAIELDDGSLMRYWPLKKPTGVLA